MTTTYAVRDDGKIVPGVIIREFGSASVLVDEPAGRVCWSWDDDQPARRRHRDHRRAVRFIRSLGAITWGSDELDDDGIVTVTGCFGQAQPDLGHAVSDREHMVSPS